MGYSVKVLSNEEFEDLPFSRVSTSLGVADPKTNTAYVRYSAYPELNKYLIDHEFEHLVEEVPTDEFEGVRYKDLGKSIGGLFKTAAPVIGTALGGPFGGAMGSVAGNTFGGGSRSSGGGSVLDYFIPQGLGYKASQMQSLMPGEWGSMGNWGGVGSSLGGALASMFGGDDDEDEGGFGGFLGNLFKNLGTGISGTVDTLSKPQTLLGSGFLTGSLAKQLPRVPALPQSVNDLKSQVQAGGSPLGQLAQSKLTSQLNQNYDPLSQPEIDAALRQLERSQAIEEEKTRDVYRSVRPGTDYTTDTTYKNDIAEITDLFSRAKADTLATRTRDTKAIFDQQRMQEIQTANRFSDSQMQQLAALAQLDVEQIMTQLDLDVAQAMYFKQAFGNLGGQLLLTGLNAQSPLTNFSASK